MPWGGARRGGGRAAGRSRTALVSRLGWDEKTPFYGTKLEPRKMPGYAALGSTQC